MTEPGGRFELRDHTADIALFVTAERPADLFATAARGLYAAIGRLVGQPPPEPVRLNLAAGDLESLLVDFLDELLYRFEMRNTVLDGFTFDRLDDNVLIATASAERIDPERSTLDREVKAVTYHDLNIEKKGRRYKVEIVLDI